MRVIAVPAAAGADRAGARGDAIAPRSTAPATDRRPGGGPRPVEIEWYVGLGTGENEEQIAAENEVVEAFNEPIPTSS